MHAQSVTLPPPSLVLLVDLAAVIGQVELSYSQFVRVLQIICSAFIV